MPTEFVDRDGYLLVKVDATWTEPAARRVIDEAHREATRRGVSRLLFDLRAWTQPQSEMTRFWSGTHLAKAMPPPFRIAAFAQPEAINRFGENAAVNRGAQFALFATETAAIEWLIGAGGMHAERT